MYFYFLLQLCLLFAACLFGRFLSPSPSSLVFRSYRGDFCNQNCVGSSFSLVPTLDYDNAFSASVSFWWLLLVPNDGSYRFALIYASFASVTALYGPLRGPDHLFDFLIIFALY